MAIAVTVEVVQIFPGQGAGDAAVTVFPSGDAASNDQADGGFSGTYFSVYRSIETAYSAKVLSADGSPFDIANLRVADAGTGGDIIVIYPLNADGTRGGGVELTTGTRDISQSFSSQVAELNFTGVSGIEIFALNNSGAPFYFDSDAFASIVVGGPDTAAPTLLSSNPADNATTIVASANLELTFSEDVVAGMGNITLTNSADPSDIRIISVGSEEVTIAGSTITIDPSSNLLAGATYSVTIDAGAITDVAGNAFAGLATATDLDFTTAAATPPVTPPVTLPTGPTSGANNLLGKAGADQISLLAGNDSYSGLTGNDTVYGNQGNDVLYGKQGDDWMHGGQGNDFLHGGQGTDTLFGGVGTDTVFGGIANDEIYGNEGDDVLYGNEGNDFVSGGQGNDIVSGGQGDDVLNGGLGDDFLVGGLGSDTFVFASGQGNDVITDFSFEQGDRLDLQGQDYVLGQNNEGQAALFLEDGGTVVLLGMTPDQFQDAFVA